MTDTKRGLTDGRFDAEAERLLEQLNRIDEAVDEGTIVRNAEHAARKEAVLETMRALAWTLTHGGEKP